MRSLPALSSETPTLGSSRPSPQGRDRVIFGGYLLAEADVHLQVRILGPLGPPTVALAVPTPERELMQKCPERLQGGPPIPKAAIDLTTVQKPALAPNQTPFQAVAHRSLPREGSAPVRAVVVEPQSVPHSRSKQVGCCSLLSHHCRC